MNYYKTRYEFDIKRKGVWTAICEYLQNYIPKDSVVLDFGSGYCDFINQIRASKKIAVDINPESKKYCGKNILFFETMNNVGKHSIYPDTIFMSNILEHLDDKELDTLFNDINKITKRGSKLIIIQPNYYYSYRKYWDDYTHKKAFSHISLVDFLKSKGFKIIKLEKRFLPYTMKSIMPKTYLLTKLYLMLPFKLFSGQMLAIAERRQ